MVPTTYTRPARARAPVDGAAALLLALAALGGPLVAEPSVGASGPGAEPGASAGEEPATAPEDLAAVAAALGVGEAAAADAVGTASAIELERALKRLGPGRIPAMLSALETGGLGDGEPLDPTRRAALRATLLEYGRGHLVPHLSGMVAESAGLDRRLLVLELLAASGGPSELDLARDAAARGHAGELLEHRLELALEATVEAILRRHPAGFALLGRLIDDSEPPVAASLVLGAGATGSPRGLQLAASLLGWDQDLDLLLLTQVGALAARAPHPIDPDLLQATRGFFTAQDPQLVRAAALAAARLEDYDAVEGLIALLTHPAPPVREAAGWALERLAGTTLPPQPERWRAWYDDERGWFEREVPRLVADLDHVRPARVVQALVELSQRRYRRDRLAASIAPLLEHARPELRRLTCSALGRLGSPAGVAALIAHLDDLDPDVAREAWLALESITGAGLPHEATAWRETYTGG